MRSAAAALGVVVAGGALGSLGGWLWWRWWGPALEGEIFKLQSGGKIWIPEPSADRGFAHVSEAAPQFAVLAAGLGVVLGVLAALLTRRGALVGLVATIVGSGLGAAAMLGVAGSLSPPDRDTLAATRSVGASVAAGMDDPGWAMYLLWPFGALAGFALALWLVTVLGASSGGGAGAAAVSEPPAPRQQPSPTPGPPG